MKHFIVLIISIVSLFAKAYILNSDVNKDRYKELKLDIWTYNDNLKILQKFIIKKGFECEIISENDLDKLKKGDVLFIIDSFAISQKAQNQIKNFVSNGGKIVFNFKSAFLNEKGKLTNKTFLEEITHLKQIAYGIAPKDNVFFVIQHLLSPIKIKDAKRLEISLYDTIPLFKGKIPDLEFVNYSITEPLIHNKKPLPSGILWDGKYKKGGWIYFSFPFYVFSSKDRLKNGWQSVIDSIIDYSLKDVAIVKYPYLKYDKMTFVSEDTEYKYVNFLNFINALKKYDVNGTAFCVGRLAKLHPELMKQAGRLKFLEIGSHSYSHTKLIDQPKEELSKVEINGNNKLLQKLSNQEIVGFRPPREETNNKLIDVMENSSLKYVLAKNLGQLKPKYIGKLMFLSRIGTDDYQYLMELDWNRTQIINKMKQEVDYVTSLNGLYTMSTHTHLMCYKSNVKMLEGLLKYIHEKKYPMLKGDDIVKLIYQVDNIDIKFTKISQGLSIDIKNRLNTNIDEFIFRIYFLNQGYNKIRCALKTKLIKYNDNYIDIKVFHIKANQKFNLILEK